MCSERRVARRRDSKCYRETSDPALGNFSEHRGRSSCQVILIIGHRVNSTHAVLCAGKYQLGGCYGLMEGPQDAY